MPGEEGKGSKAHALFTVTAAAAPARCRRRQATIRSIEFGFRGPSTLHDGELVRFENEGYPRAHGRRGAGQEHEGRQAGRQGPAAPARKRRLEKLIAGPPVGFAGPVSHEAFQQETITAKPGIYVEVCFMETQDGRSHTLLGMERIIKITK